MATDLEKLVVSLEASMTKYEKAMQRAVAVSDTNARKVESRWNKLNVGKEAFAGFSRGAVAAAASLLSVSAVIGEIKAGLKTFGDINDKSIAGGLDPEFFQGIAYQAKLAGVEVETVADATATFNKLSGQAVEGRGKLVAQLKAEHPELLRSIELATTQEQRIRLVADAIKDAKNQSEAAVIATAAFGDAGLRLVQVFQGGAAEIDTMAQKARALGLIIDDDLVSNADALGDEFDTVSQIVDLKLKKALIDLAPALIDLVGLAGQLADALQQAHDLFLHPGDFVDVIANGSHAAGDLQRLQTSLRNELGQSTLDAGLGTGETAGGIRSVMMGGDPNTFNDIGGGIDQRDLEQWFGVKMTQAVKAARAASPPPPPPPHGAGGGDLGDHGHGFGQTRGGNVPGTGNVQQVADGFGKVSDKAKLATGSVREFNHQMDDAVKSAQDLAGSFIDDFVDGKSVIDTATDALKDLEKQALRMLANQAIAALFGAAVGGPIGAGAGATGGVLGALFGGGRASGGPVVPGMVYKVNENTPNSEYFAPRVPGTIIPRLPNMAGMGRGGGGETIDINVADPSGLMASIADTRIRTAAGNIVRFSVNKGLDATRRNFKGIQQRVATNRV